MFKYKNLFYSFSLDEINGFEAIKEEATNLSIYPKDYDEKAIYDYLGLEKHKQIRKTLDSIPHFEKALKREAKMNLSKRISQIKKDKMKSPNPSTWGVRPGHMSFENSNERLRKLHNEVNGFFDYNCEIAGDFLYPPNGFRVWHTNKYDVESWFAFFVDVDKPQQSFFKFVDNESNEVVTHWDAPNSLTIFKISKSELFWHCIGTNSCTRWSQGFTIPDNWKEKIGL